MARPDNVVDLPVPKNPPKFNLPDLDGPQLVKELQHISNNVNDGPHATKTRVDHILSRLQDQIADKKGKKKTAAQDAMSTNEPSETAGTPTT